MAGWCEIFITDQLPFFKNGGFPPIALWLLFFAPICSSLNTCGGGKSRTQRL